MKYALLKILMMMSIIVFAVGFSNKGTSSNTEMINLLAEIHQTEFDPENRFCPEARVVYYDSLLKVAKTFYDSAVAQYNLGNTYLEVGDELKSVSILENLLKLTSEHDFDTKKQKSIVWSLAIAYLRLGERVNCVHDHSGESCIFPISGNGIHVDKEGSQKAIKLYEELLKYDSTDIESRWLLNVAYMTIGGYPQQVPPPYLLKGLDKNSSALVKPFTDVAAKVGLAIRNQSGGSIVDDFDNDGYLDIVTSSWSLLEGMHYFHNNSNGIFTDLSEHSSLGELTGGLNIMQTDYNNDGLKDIFVLRGAWKGKFGQEPNSLLKNNGDGTFSDVTKASGLLSLHPTQTATWADFNNDGWLDVFIGNETTQGMDYHPCELYMNNKNGTFMNVAFAADCNITAYVKGVTSGDYDNDGWTDIFISTLNGQKVLFKNEGIKYGTVHFRDVSQQAGLSKNQAHTFPTWFWDYDNDGWLDILVCSYEFTKSLAWYAAEEALNIPDNAGKVILFRNNHDGTFEEVSEKTGLNKVAFAMGSNFGDIDNDGYLDIYLGTGNPTYQSLVANKMFKNINGQRFADVTTSARVGNLQKGHGVSFADLDNDGDLDIYTDMGGAFSGDAYPNSLYINPGQNNNQWINLSLEGTVSNKAAIGARIKITFIENGKMRSVYRDVNSGGSFGSNPLTQHIGIGKATVIESIQVKWPGSISMQIFKNIRSGQYLKIKEGNNSYSVIAPLRKVDFTSQKSMMMNHPH